MDCRVARRLDDSQMERFDQNQLRVMIYVKVGLFISRQSARANRDIDKRVGVYVTTKTTHLPERRAFLKGRFHDEAFLRPPGALELAAFVETCTRCGDCAANCPQAIITADDDGFPKVDITARGCTFCGACADACAPEAIQPALQWAYRADVSDTCLSVQGITCRTCEDHCDESAIRFRLMAGGRSAPSIDPETCTGCGACVAPCPSDAITVERPASQLTASATQASEINVCTISADA